MARQHTAIPSWVAWGSGLMLLASCASDPLSAAPWSVDGPSSWYELRLGAEVIGVEERAPTTGPGGDRLCRRRWLRILVAGEVVEGVEQECWRRSGGRDAGGEAAALDAFGGPTGSGRVGLPFGEEVDARVVRVEEGEEVWVLAVWDGPEAAARFDGGGLVEGRLGEVSWRRVAERPGPWPAVDVHARLSVPIGEPVERPRRRRVGRYLVDGERVEVDTPLDAELPAIPLRARGEGEGAVAAFVGEQVDATDVVGAAAQLSEAVARAVRDEVVPGRVDGGDVLAMGRGDCTEHVALFLEGARALGLVARPVAGLLYLDDGPIGAGFYPHAWAEVRVGERWVAADPTLGTFPADAARLPLDLRVDVAMDRVAAGLTVVVLDLR